MSRTDWAVLVGGPFDGKRVRITGPPPLLLLHSEEEGGPIWTIERYAPKRDERQDGRTQRWYWQGADWQGASE